MAEERTGMDKEERHFEKKTDRNMTMADVAALSGVGKSTVSRYFNGGYVKEETKKRIRQVIDEYNYEPNAFARLNARTSHVIGVVVPTLNSKITGRVITSIDRYLREHGYTAIIQNSDHDIQLELQNLRKLARLKVDGIILSAISITPEHKAVIEEAGVPVVVLAQNYPDGVCVLDDDYQAGYEMGACVGSRGFTKIGYVGVSQTDEAVGRIRKKGLSDGLAANGNPGMTTVLGDYSFESGYEAAKQLFEREDRPEVVICATDRMAYGVYKYLAEAGLQIPEDVSVTGFGGYDESVLLSPPLTTLKFDSYRLGELGAETMLRVIYGEPVSKKQVVGYEFVQGGSVKMDNI